MDIQTDGDYTKRVVTPFGTTRLKTLHGLQFVSLGLGRTSWLGQMVAHASLSIWRNSKESNSLDQYGHSFRTHYNTRVALVSL